MNCSNNSLTSVLFPGVYRRRILSLLLLHPERALHVREIARLTASTVGSLTRELRSLYEAGLLERERSGNQLRYKANVQCPVFSELAAILRKTVGVVDVLADALAPASESLQTAFVFGSLARGAETAGSDVDLMLIGTLSFGDALQLLYPAQAQLGREINPKVFSAQEWRAALEKQEPFLIEVMKQPRLFVVGSDKELA